MAIHATLAIQHSACFFAHKDTAVAHSWVEPGHHSVYGLFNQSQIYSSGSTKYKFYSFTDVYVYCSWFDFPSWKSDLRQNLEIMTLNTP